MLTNVICIPSTFLLRHLFVPLMWIMYINLWNFLFIWKSRKFKVRNIQRNEGWRALLTWEPFVSMLLLLCMMESAMTIYEKKNYLKMMEKKWKVSIFLHTRQCDGKENISVLYWRKLSLLTIIFNFFYSNPIMNLLLKFVSISLCLCSYYIIHPYFSE